jgi:hypothetical protein
VAGVRCARARAWQGARVSAAGSAAECASSLRPPPRRACAAQYEMQGDVTSQRRWEAYDKLGTFGIYALSVVVGIQALGLEVRR